MAIPSVASRVTGCVDAVLDGVTGALVPARSAPALVDAIARYLDDPELRARHGAAARRRALEQFAPERIWSGLLAGYAAMGETRAMADAPAERAAGSLKLRIKPQRWALGARAMQLAERRSPPRRQTGARGGGRDAPPIWPAEDTRD